LLRTSVPLLLDLGWFLSQHVKGILICRVDILLFGWDDDFDFVLVLSSDGGCSEIVRDLVVSLGTPRDIVNVGKLEDVRLDPTSSEVMLTA